MRCKETLTYLFTIMRPSRSTNRCSTRATRRLCCCFAVQRPTTESSSLEELSTAFRLALQSNEGKDTGLSPQLVRGLLVPALDDTVEDDNMLSTSHVDDWELPSDDVIAQKDDPIIFYGLPVRPFYRELSRRVLALSCKYSENEEIDDPFIASDAMGMKEYSPVRILSPPKYYSQSLCSEWLRTAGDAGILRLLGMRHTIGTAVGLLPPDWTALLQAARAPHRQNAAPHDNLSVAGRARCKHAHRGSQKFFGAVKGGTREKNEAATKTIRKILRNAAWINIHTFASMETPTLEVRVAEGYGARWTAEWSTDPVCPTNVVFRGFLEPQMENGHESRWRH
mmetsp:Transcript_28960/g.64271  ORF Transcript_28960/g.64271 Transcript_28960/m.64271 type:complete len:338 (-) Transcript_28960:32-1045(-)